jgi:hypothetical protein
MKEEIKPFQTNNHLSEKEEIVKDIQILNIS